MLTILSPNHFAEKSITVIPSIHHCISLVKGWEMPVLIVCVARRENKTRDCSFTDRTYCGCVLFNISSNHIGESIAAGIASIALPITVGKFSFIVPHVNPNRLN